MLVLHPWHLAAQSGAPSRSDVARSPGQSETVGATIDDVQRTGLTTLSAFSIRAAVAKRDDRLAMDRSAAKNAVFGAQQPSAQQRRSWIGRHPVLFGTLVGFGAGYLIGYLPGDDAVFYDFTAEFNGMVLGGVGAGAGALTGALVGQARN